MLSSYSDSQTLRVSIYVVEDDPPVNRLIFQNEFTIITITHLYLVMDELRTC